MNVARVPQDSLRILHRNVHSWIDPETGGSNSEAVQDLLTEHEPHVVSLVEVDETWGRPSTLEALAQTLGYAAVFTPIFEYGDERSVGGFGNAILSRLPLVKVRQQQLTWPTTVYDGTEPSEPRALTHVTVRLTSGALLDVGSTHLPRTGATTRERALTALADQLTSLPRPWIVCEDFNVPGTVWSGMQPSRTAVPNPPVPTYPSTSPAEPIDYALVSSGILCTASVLPATGSDHLAVLLSLTVT